VAFVGSFLVMLYAGIGARLGVVPCPLAACDSALR
jgi:hypothetical protein